MSEGGRKVWNREQLEQLNNGAILLMDMGAFGPQPIQQNKMWDELRKQWSYSYAEFGDERGWWDLPRSAETYPIEVIWEPSDGEG